MTRNLWLALALAGGALTLTVASRADVSEDARRQVQQGARLVDVRSVEEFASGHLKGAVNIPVQNLAQRLRELEPKDKPVVVYCRSGARSASAARMLKEAGFTQVLDLGAMSNWKDAPAGGKP